MKIKKNVQEERRQKFEEAKAMKKKIGKRNTNKKKR